MRVVQLGPYPPPHGGVQSNLVAIRDYIRRQGHACAVINLTRHRGEERDGVFYPGTPQQVVRLLLNGRYDIIHLHIGGELPLRLLMLALVCTLVPRAKTVFTFHSGGYPSSPAGRTARPFSLRGFVFRRFDCVIGVNQQLCDLFRRFGVPNDRIRLIYPHTVPAAPDPGGALPEPLASFFARHDPVFITVGLLEPEYDLPLQIEAMQTILERLPRAGLAIAGSGSLEADLRARIAAVPYADQILLCGDVQHAATIRAIRQATALLRTTLYDGDSVAVREALHLGTPVIATDNGMRPAGVRLIPVHDRDALVHAVEQVVTAPSERPAAQAPDESNVKAVRDIYEKILTSGRYH
ncbi:MAG TPA: glycosyltransferase family 4 protein [Bryobacteraceae bacterium]